VIIRKDNGLSSARIALSGEPGFHPGIVLAAGMLDLGPFVVVRAEGVAMGPEAVDAALKSAHLQLGSAIGKAA